MAGLRRIGTLFLDQIHIVIANANQSLVGVSHREGQERGEQKGQAFHDANGLQLCSRLPDDLTNRPPGQRL